jgi:glycine/sarcosine N-methyltransferase
LNSSTPELAASLLGVQAFYDSLADSYDLYYEDWIAAGKQQAAIMIQTLGALKARGQRCRILDCACGIGTQALGFAAAGEEIVGSDFSRAAVHRAAREGHSHLLRVPLAVADMRALSFGEKTFDVVICADNAIPHLKGVDLHQALAEMYRVLRSNGSVLMSIRDYDRALRERPAATVPSVRRSRRGLVMSFQLWDWSVDGKSYALEHFQLVPREGSWSVHHRVTVYHPIRRRQLTSILKTVGFRDVTWHLPTDTGYDQPIVVASK